MSKITSTKLGRALATKRFNNNHKRMSKNKIVGYAPARERRWEEIGYRGNKLQVFVSDGQVINARKHYEKQFN